MSQENGKCESNEKPAAPIKKETSAKRTAEWRKRNKDKGGKQISVMLCSEAADLLDIMEKERMLSPTSIVNGAIITAHSAFQKRKRIDQNAVINAVNGAVEGAKEIDHAALAAAHWDGYTGPLIEAAITAGGYTPDPATLALLRYVAISHWVHGAKHERESGVEQS